MRGISGTGMSAMGMAKASLRLKKCIMNKLNTRPGTSAAEVTRLPIRSPVCTPGSKMTLMLMEMTNLHKAKHVCSV